MKTVEKEPEVVQALPSETVTLSVSNSFYDDVKNELHIDPEASKKQALEFQDSLDRQSSSLQELTRVMLAPPSVTNRGPQPRPKPKVVEE